MLRELTHSALTRFETYVRSKRNNLPPYEQLVHEHVAIKLTALFALNQSINGTPFFDHAIEDWRDIPILELTAILKAQQPSDSEKVLKQYETLEKRYIY